MRDGVIAIAHRGAPLRARENTLASISAALDVGGDWVEIDAKATSDGVAIVLHDTTFSRLWGDPRAVTETPFVELRATLPGGEDGIPTLAQAVELVARNERVLLIDVADRSIAGAVMHNDAVLDNVTSVAFTGDPEGLASIRGELPEATIAMSWEQPGLPPDDILERVRPNYLNQTAELVDDSFVAESIRRGFAVSTYTVDTEGEMNRVIDLGVTAIISNDIELLRRVIDERTAARKR